MKPPLWVVVVLVGALVGVVFAGLSTSDFVQHLDRQEHSLHCSFIPGAAKEAGASGCQVAMMSEYSSVFRSSVWGGIPISLPAMAVFAFIGFFALDLLITRRKHDARATAFLAAAATVPVLASLVMLVISLTKLGSTCTMCVAIYAASAICFTGALVLWRRAVRLRGTGDVPDSASGGVSGGGSGGGDEPAFASAGGNEAAFAGARSDEPAFAAAARERTAEPAMLGAKAPAASSRATEQPPSSRVRALTVDAGAVASTSFLAGAFAIGVAFVAIPLILYLVMAPDHGRFVGTCDGLIKPDDTYGVMVNVDPPSSGGVPALEILDPLCPACKAFEKQLTASGYREQLARKAILFPLDQTCNWMLTEVTHPGACTVSEAVLCAGDRAHEVIAWAFDEQERILAESKKDPKAAARIVGERFPKLASCIGSAEAKSKLNKSLRWAVANNIVVRTPQLFVAGVKLCDQDVDLGLAYSLRIMLERHEAKTLVAPGVGSGAGSGSDSGSAANPAAVEPVSGTGTKPSGASGTEAKPSGASGAAPDTASGTGTSGSAPDTASGTGTSGTSGTSGAGTDTKPSGTSGAGTDTKPSGTKPSGTKPSGTKPSGDSSGDKPVTSPSEAPAGEPAPAAPANPPAAPASPPPAAPETAPAPSAPTTPPASGGTP